MKGPLSFPSPRGHIPESQKKNPMRTLSPFVAACLVSLTASLIVVGGAVFALFTFWPLLLLALIAGVAGLKARTVRQHSPPTSPRR